MTPNNTPPTPQTNHTELWRLEQLALVSQVATQVTGIYDLDQLLVRVVGLIYQTFEFYAVSLYTLERDRLVSRSMAGPSDNFVAENAFIPTEKIEIPMGEGIIGWVAANQQELVVSDVWHEKRFRYSPEAPNTQAEIALPLKVEDRLLGVLDVQLDYPENFDDIDMLVLRALAGQVSMAIEDTRLYGEANRRGEHLATISAVSWAVASILDVDELLGQVSELIRKYFDYPCVQVFTVHPGSRQVEYRAGSGRQAELLRHRKLAYSLDDKRGIIPLVARTGQTILANDVTIVPAFRHSEISPAITQSELTVPLIYSGQILGVLDVQSDKLDAFTPGDQATIETLAANIAVALRNANLYRTEQWRRQVADSSRRISGALITDVNLDNILDTILTELKRNLPADVLAIWLLGAAHPGADAAAPPPAPDVHLRAGRQSRLYMSTVQADGPVKFPPDFIPHNDPWLAAGLKADQPITRRFGQSPDPIAAGLGYSDTHSAIVAPLRVKQRTLGLLTMAHHEPGRYSAEAQAITTAFANQAAIALENARLFQVAQDEAKISNALLKVAEATQDFDDLEQALTAITQIASLLAEVDRCAIWLRAQGAPVFEPVAASGFSPAATEFFSRCILHRESTPLIKQLNRQHNRIIIPHAADDNRLPAELTGQMALDAVVCLPLVAHGELLGLMLVSFESQAAIREDDLRLISGVAHQAAVAIESKYLYEQKLRQERLAHELELAQDIQATLIPSELPAPPGWQTAAAWQSAQEVGGDFYDVMNVTPTRLGIVIADVAGKGMPAALYMALTRSLIRATVPGQTDPRQVLLRTNQLLIPDTRRGKFVSLFYAILNTHTGELVYSNAGHNPPLLIRANHTIERLWVPGMVLGVQPDIEPQLGRAHLHPGDGVVFYTDGVTEVFDSESSIFGEERLREILQQTWDDGPKIVVDNVRQAVNRFSATALPNDDFTLLIFRRQDKPGYNKNDEPPKNYSG
jgi:sigma-B regulation protein RsbU (phosphoserine phosphatase)